MIDSRRPVWHRDHPRMRGEHGSADDGEGREEGSSPHARGAPINVIAPKHVGGIIPACAGSTAPDAQVPTRKQDHPRMRGEHALSALKSVTCDRIIPACAGSTW